MSYSPYGIKLIGFLKNADLNITTDPLVRLYYFIGKVPVLTKESLIV
jgi:hypothetical protein